MNQRSYDPFLFELQAAEKAAAEGSQYLYCRGIKPVRIDHVALDVTLAQVVHMTVPFEVDYNDDDKNKPTIITATSVRSNQLSAGVTSE